MPLQFQRIDTCFKAGYVRVWYRDEFGQPRFFEFTEDFNWEMYGNELIRQVNELLARPRPSECVYAPHELPTPGDDYCANCSLQAQFWSIIPVCPASQPTLPSLCA